MKAFADDKFIITENMKFSFHKVENTAGKEENAGIQYFLLFPQCFQNSLVHSFLPCLFLCLSVCLSVCLFAYLSVCLKKI